MRTWWICRYAVSGEADIIHMHNGNNINFHSAHLPMIGPYWSYAEAQRVLDHWTK